MSLTRLLEAIFDEVEYRLARRSNRRTSKNKKRTTTMATPSWPQRRVELTELKGQ